jgi:signal transduction histidine kinase
MMTVSGGAEASKPECPDDWREATVDRVLTIIGVAAAFILGWVVLVRAPPRFDSVTAIMALAVGAVLAARALPQLGLRGRTWVAVVGLALAAAAPMFHFGPMMGSALTLAVAAVVAALVLGRRCGLAATAVFAVFLGVCGVLVERGMLAVRAEYTDPSRGINWIRPAVTCAVLTAVLVVLVDHVVRQLARQYATATDALDRLQGETVERELREQRQAEWLRALQRLAASGVIESGHLPAAFAEITEAGAQALGIERCSVWLLDEAGERLHCFDLYEKTAHRHTRGMELRATDYPAYFRGLAEERALAAEDARNDPRTAALGDYLRAQGIGALLDAPIRYGERLVGVVCHEHVGPPRLFGAEACGFAGSMGDFAARALAASERGRQDQALRLAYEQLVQLHRRLEGAKEEERRELAHELHDELGQSLTALKLRLQMVSRAPAAATSAPDITAALAVIDELISRVRRISVDLRPPLLDEVGLAPALRTYLDAQAALSGLAIAFDAASVQGRLPAEIEIGAFRVVQEGVTNALRHAQAASLRVELRRDPKLLHLRVHDDGRGFDVDAARQEGTRGARFGLVGMRERLRGLGGTLEIRSRPGQGTEVEARLPLG